jgi:pyruvate-formate lyase-activating enzyme
MKKTLSCVDLHHSLYLAPDELRTCCKRFFVDGKMKGDVVLVNIKKGEQPTPAQILNRKRELYEQINEGMETPCSGCPWLSEEEWPELSALDIRFLSFEAHSVCNLKCTYCSDTYYGGKRPSYDVDALYSELKMGGALEQCAAIVWGGGEPLAGKNFAENIVKFTNDLKPTYNKVFTNAILYSEPLAKLLAEGRASITTSIDAGTPETYEKVRGANQLHRVLGNLRRYVREGAKDVTVKYILTTENASMAEVTAFFDLVRQYELLSCSFQISSDFKNETLSDDAAYSAVSLYLMLKKAGAGHVFFDDHVRPRINAYATKAFPMLQKQFGEDLADPRQFTKVVVWGAGQFSRRMLSNSIFFSQVAVDFFVDKDSQKVGREFFGKTIKPVTAILETDLQIVIGASGQYAEICEELSAMGVTKDRILSGIIF